MEHKCIPMVYQDEPEGEPYLACSSCGRRITLPVWARKFDFSRQVRRIAIKSL